MIPLDIAFSTCPNDTFVFHAMLHHCIDTGNLRFIPHMHDVEDLNKKAFSKTFHVSKLSFYAYLKLRQNYEILDAGSALGYGCGPLLVARSADISLSEAKIAVPGEYTTAYLLLKLWRPEIRNIEITRFDNILEKVQMGKYAGSSIRNMTVSRSSILASGGKVKQGFRSLWDVLLSEKILQPSI